LIGVGQRGLGAVQVGFGLDDFLAVDAVVDAQQRLV